jgi:hypothetical protein
MQTDINPVALSRGFNPLPEPKRLFCVRNPGIVCLLLLLAILAIYYVFI